VKLLVTGREGQVVTSLMERGALRSGIEIVAVGRPELDLLDAASVERTIAAIKPDVVVSAAAYTAVDQAEDEPEAAFAINERGAGAVAAAAALIGAPVIHLSTDYVFAGQGDQPYAEDDLTAPVSIYGKSKLAGEAAVAAANPRQIILRTAWVYSPFGKNFVKTMLHLARERDHLTVVADQWGNPTSALDIADGVLDIASALRDGHEAFGIFHMAGTGSTNWADFARHIFAISAPPEAPLPMSNRS
jgi:dTDP-4-dehydrorhamnose reductase